MSSLDACFVLELTKRHSLPSAAQAWLNNFRIQWNINQWQNLLFKKPFCRLYIYMDLLCLYKKKMTIVTGHRVKIQLSTACLDQALWIPLDFTNAGKNTDLTWKGLLVDNSLKGNKINNNYCYTAENNYFLNSVCSHWLLQNHMTSSNETVSCQNLSRQHCKIYDITG